MDDAALERAVRRINRWMLAAAFAGTVTGGFLKGWRWAAGFAIGAAAGYLNFRWLKQIVDALGGARPRKRLALFLGLRYLLLAGGAYVILNFSTFSLAGALWGLFVPVAAVLMEIVFELIYART